MTLGDHVDAYTLVLSVWWAEPDIYEAVSALIARDCTSRWWESES